MNNVPLRVLPEILDASAEIVALAEAQRSSFVRYPTAQALAKRSAGRLDFAVEKHVGYERDQCEILPRERMDSLMKEGIEDVLASIGHDVRAHFLQLQRYGEGDFVLPHRDYVSQTLFVLTDSTVDGLTVQRDDILVKVPDRAGNCILMDASAWHWVDPVQEPVRYTLSILPPLIVPEQPALEG